MSRQSAALSSAFQLAMPSELDGKWGSECFNTRLRLPTLFCAEYSVKLMLKLNENKGGKCGVKPFHFSHADISGRYREAVKVSVLSFANLDLY